MIGALGLLLTLGGAPLAPASLGLSLVPCPMSLSPTLPNAPTPQPGPTILLFPNPSAPNITVQAIVSLGTLNSHEQALAQVIRDTILDATQDFNKDDMRRYSTLAGQPMRCTLSADHIRIRLDMPKGQLDIAGQLICDILEHPRFDPDTVQKDLDAMPFRKRSYWSEALLPWQLDFKRIRQDQLVAFVAKNFIPAATTITISGPIGTLSDDPADYWPRISEYVQPKPSYTKDYSGPTPTLSKHDFPVTTAELFGSQFGASDASTPLNLLTATALGVGKWSAMHRILREKLGISYEQEAAVTPTPIGLRTRLIMVCAPSDKDPELCETMRNALLDDVKTWNQDILDRALGMAQAYLTFGAPATPLFLDAGSPISDSQDDQDFLKAYWHQKSGEDWDPNKLLALMRQITLEDLKKDAEKMLTDAQTLLISGRR